MSQNVNMVNVVNQNGEVGNQQIRVVSPSGQVRTLNNVGSILIRATNLGGRFQLHPSVAAGDANARELIMKAVQSSPLRPSTSAIVTGNAEREQRSESTSESNTNGRQTAENSMQSSHLATLLAENSTEKAAERYTPPPALERNEINPPPKRRSHRGFTKKCEELISGAAAKLSKTNTVHELDGNCIEELADVRKIGEDSAEPEEKKEVKKEGVPKKRASKKAKDVTESGDVHKNQGLAEQPELKNEEATSSQSTPPAPTEPKRKGRKPMVPKVPVEAAVTSSDDGQQVEDVVVKQEEQPVVEPPTVANNDVTMESDNKDEKMDESTDSIRRRRKRQSEIDKLMNMDFGPVNGDFLHATPKEEDVKQKIEFAAEKKPRRSRASKPEPEETLPRRPKRNSVAKPSRIQDDTVMDEPPTLDEHHAHNEDIADANLDAEEKVAVSGQEEKLSKAVKSPTTSSPVKKEAEVKSKQATVRIVTPAKNVSFDSSAEKVTPSPPKTAKVEVAPTRKSLPSANTTHPQPITQQRFILPAPKPSTNAIVYNVALSPRNSTVVSASRMVLPLPPNDPIPSPPASSTQSIQGSEPSSIVSAAASVESNEETSSDEEVLFEKWDVNEAADWIRRVTGSDAAAESFRAEEIDGTCLAVLSMDEIRSVLKVSYGACVKLRTHLPPMQEAYQQRKEGSSRK